MFVRGILAMFSVADLVAFVTGHHLLTQVVR